MNIEITVDSETRGHHLEEDFRRRYPLPTLLDFRCTRCRAAVGEQCTGAPRPVRTSREKDLGTDRCHAPRMDVMHLAHRAHHLDIMNLLDNDIAEVSGVPFTPPMTTDRYVKFMKRVGGRMRTEEKL